MDVDQDTGDYVIAKWSTYPKNADRMDRLTTFFKTEIRRLKRLKNVIWNTNGRPANKDDAEAATAHQMPFSEWNSIWEFVDANIVAFATALRYLNGLDKFPDRNTQNPPWSVSPAVSDTYALFPNGSHYDPWIIEPDDHAYGTSRL
jgi:hypothetical protein